MSLLLLSDDSLQKILKCSNKDITTIARFGRTVSRTKSAATAVGAKPRVHAIRLCFVKPTFGTKSDESFSCESYATHIYKGTVEDKTGKYYPKEINGSDYSNKRHLKYMREKELLTTCEAENLDENTLIESVMKELSSAFSKVESVQRLELFNCQIDSKFLSAFDRLTSQVSCISELYLHQCQVYLTVEEFRTFIKLFKLKSLEMMSVKLCEDLICDKIISNLSNSIELCCEYDDSQSAKRIEEDLKPIFCGITDKTLDAWIRNFPKRVDLWKTSTNFTFAGVWRFIKALNELITGEERNYDLGVINKVTEKSIIAAQRYRKIKWDYERDEHHPFLINYELTLQNGWKVYFLVKVPEYRTFNALLMEARLTARHPLLEKFRRRLKEILAGEISFIKLFQLHNAMCNLMREMLGQKVYQLNDAYEDLYAIMGEIRAEQIPEQEYIDLLVNDPEELHNRLQHRDDERDDVELSEKELSDEESSDYDSDEPDEEGYYSNRIRVAIQ